LRGLDLNQRPLGYEPNDVTVSRRLGGRFEHEEDIQA